jgi:DNA modification methylase
MRPNPWGIQGLGNVIGLRISFGRGAPGYFQADEGAMRNLQDQKLARLAQDHNSDSCRNGSGEAPAITADTSLTVEMLPLETLQPYARNARTHSKKQIRQIAKSIRRFGFCNPILIDDRGEIIAGHGRVAAAKLLGISVVPTVRLSHFAEAEKRAYILADNRLAEKAGWDKEILAIELQALIDLDFEVELTGFETADIDLCLEEAREAAGEPSGPEDEIPAYAGAHAVSRAGDLWQLGPHRLLCDDARDPAASVRLLGDAKAEFVFTDPPYNVPIDGHVCGLGRIRHRSFAMGCGEMSEAEFARFLTTIFTQLAAHTTDGSIHQICMDWRHIPEMLKAGHAVYSELKNVCVWNKNNAGMGSFYRSKHELVFVWKSGTSPHINTFELGQYGRSRSNVWDYAGVNTLKPGRLDELAMHPTVKPVALVADAIKDCSRRNGLVLDPFAGSGTVLIAAERTGRRARAMEIDPHYIDVAVKRWQDYAGKSAVLVATGQTFEEASERSFNGPAPPPPPPLQPTSLRGGLTR